MRINAVVQPKAVKGNAVLLPVLLAQTVCLLRRQLQSFLNIAIHQNVNLMEHPGGGRIQRIIHVDKPQLRSPD